MTGLTQRRHRQIKIFPKPSPGRPALRAVVAPLAGCLCLLVACSGEGSGAATPATPGRVTLTGRAAGGVPVPLTWVAFQDGDGPWQRAIDQAGVYTLDAPSGRYAVAFVCNAAPAVQLGEVIAATVQELNDIQAPCPIPLPGSPVHRWAGTIKGAGNVAATTITFASLEGGAFRATINGAGYTIDLPPGSYDLVAAQGNLLNLKRGIKIDAAGTTDVDFAMGSVMAKSQPLPAIVSDPQEIVEAGVFFTSPRGARADFFGPKGTVALLDPGDLAPGDSQRVYVDARGTKAATFRGLFRSVAGGPLPAFTLPPALAGAGAVPAVGTKSPVTLRPKVSFDLYPSARFYQASMFTDMPDKFVWVMNVGAGWLGGRTSFELPDLSGVAGFDPAWGPPLNLALAVEIIAVSSSRGFGALLDDLPPTGPGVEVTYAKKIVTLQPAP
jgi:hypothetical protein